MKKIICTVAFMAQSLFYNQADATAVSPGIMAAASDSVANQLSSYMAESNNLNIANNTEVEISAPLTGFAVGGVLESELRSIAGIKLKLGLSPTKRKIINFGIGYTTPQGFGVDVSAFNALASRDFSFKVQDTDTVISNAKIKQSMAGLVTDVKYTHSKGKFSCYAGLSVGAVHHHFKMISKDFISGSDDAVYAVGTDLMDNGYDSVVWGGIIGFDFEVYSHVRLGINYRVLELGLENRVMLPSVDEPFRVKVSKSGNILHNIGLSIAVGF